MPSQTALQQMAATKPATVEALLSEAVLMVVVLVSGPRRAAMRQQWPVTVEVTVEEIVEFDALRAGE